MNSQTLETKCSIPFPIPVPNSGRFFIKLSTMGWCQVDFSLSLFLSIEKFCRESIMKMATLFIYMPVTEWCPIPVLHLQLSGWAMVELTQCLLYQHGDDLPLVPSICPKKPGMVMWACKLNAERVSMGGSLGLTQSNELAQCPSERSYLENPGG